MTEPIKLTLEDGSEIIGYRDVETAGKAFKERPPLGVRYPKVSTEERPSMRVFSEEIQSLLIRVWNY